MSLFPRRRSFLDKDPPPGYVPGIGRGATGFTTRSDVGTGRLPPRGGGDVGSDDEGKFGDADDDGLLGGAEDKEDEEADAIYKAVDDRLKLRNKKRVRIDDVVDNKDEISRQFVDLKKGLGDLSEDQWAALPEVGDLTKRNKRLRQEASRNRVEYAAPDSLWTGSALGGGGMDTSVDIRALTAEREKLLGSKLDADLGLVEYNSSQLDQDGYLKEISTLETSNDEEVAKISTILNSYTKADPKNPEGWIARARLEEFKKNFDQAKKLIDQGCAMCPKNEDIWIESVRLHQHDPKTAKIIITQGVKANPRSLRLWLKATELEQEQFNKKRMLRKALESLPTSEELWAQLLEIEEDTQDSVKIAEKALEIIPTSEKFWLKLVGLQDYATAKTTLNRARKALGNDNVSVWLTACHLECENNPESDKAEKLVKKAFKECTLSRDEWYAHAVKFEDDGLTYLATLIVSEIIQNEDDDYERWLEDSKKYEEHVYILKTILNQIVMHFPKKTVIWRRLIQLYKTHFTTEEMYAVFDNIVELFPKNAVFWLMYSKEMWKTSGDIEGAKKILHRALKGDLVENTDVWCALIKLETVEGHWEAVETLYEQAKDTLRDPRIWYKWVTFLRQRGSTKIALSVVDQALDDYVDCWKLYLQKSQILEETGDMNGCKSVLSLGSRQCPKSPEVWIRLSQVDAQLGNLAKARSDLDLALLKVDKEQRDKVWLEKLELERRSNPQQTQNIGVILTKALQEFPNSSLLWAFQLKYHTKKSQRKTAYQDALTATNNDVRILILIGVNFWKDGKHDKAQRWFERAVMANEDFGDAWAWHYNLLTGTLKLGEGDEEYDAFLDKLRQVEPRHGDLWPVVNKRLVNIGKDVVEVLKLTAQELLKAQ